MIPSASGPNEKTTLNIPGKIKHKKLTEGSVLTDHFLFVSLVIYTLQF